MKKVFPYIVLLAALCLATSAAYYSVFGLSKLFSAQTLAIIIMAGTLEVSKLITATYLHRYWKKLNILIKMYLTTAVVVLMFITSIGIYGFLVSAYQTTADQLTIMDKQIAVIELKKERFNDQLTSYSAEKEQLGESISELSKGLSNNVVQYKDKESGKIITTTSSSTRRVLNDQLDDFKEQRNNISIKIESMTDSITKLDLQVLDIESNSEASAEIGPLKYLSELLDKPMDEIVNWFILIFIFVFDPLAIILLVSANKAFDIVNETKYKLYEKQDVQCSIPDGYEYNTPYPIPEEILNAEDNQEENVDSVPEEKTEVKKKKKRFRTNTKVIS